MKIYKVVVAVLILSLLVVLPVSAGPATQNLTWKVRWGVQESDGWWATKWFASASPATSLFTVNYFRPGLLPSGIQRPIGLTGVWATYAAGSNYLYQVTGFQIAPAQGQDSFAGMRWNPSSCLPGPQITLKIDWKAGRAKRVMIEIVNYTQSTLFVSSIGRKKSITLLPGNTWVGNGKTTGEIILRKEDASRCADVWWRLN